MSTRGKCILRYYSDVSFFQNNVVSVTSLLGGNSDNTGSGIARRIGTTYIPFEVFVLSKEADLLSSS